jgi:hypothetical protein
MDGSALDTGTANRFPGFGRVPEKVSYRRLFDVEIFPSIPQLGGGGSVTLRAHADLRAEIASQRRRLRGLHSDSRAIAISARCAILEAVRALPQLACRKGMNHVIAAAVCALLLFFAVGTKLAAYHPHEQAAKSIASTKVWQTADSTPSIVEQAKIAPQSFSPVAIWLSVLAVEHPRVVPRSEIFISPPDPGLSPFAVRPPPAC